MIVPTAAGRVRPPSLLGVPCQGMVDLIPIPKEAQGEGVPGGSDPVGQQWIHDRGRTNLYNDSVDDLVRWMRKEKTHSIIVLLIKRYLAARGTQSMTQIWLSCGGRRDVNQTGFQLATAHDLLGWKNFVDGRIHKKFVEIQEEYIVSRPSNQQRSRKSSAKWASGLVDMIIRITHRQWLYRNEKLHYKQQFGAESPREYQQIMARITHLHNHTDPEDLLPADQCLLDTNLKRYRGQRRDARSGRWNLKLPWQHDDRVPSNGNDATIG
ncbi:hypothetical protein THAOC_09891 [Thalassiosira oceanica]|uniref:Uncharacterized protein n=1 Tax=Thalassiosira oceanica TaxID=159749 RepID=K0T6E9_THAOC|nr:hypothetical protein THAOC_09891 [Thalassiosira oceanica]|eukprot:EJK68901.1 hypothetical protein THAOC_09891 [Thalassiosira oceanica]